MKRRRENVQLYHSPKRLLVDSLVLPAGRLSQERVSEGDDLCVGSSREQVQDTKPSRAGWIVYADRVPQESSVLVIHKTETSLWTCQTQDRGGRKRKLDARNRRSGRSSREL